MNEKIRIKDIAERAGVSVGTVDRVLHDRPNVSKPAREKVERALKERKISHKLIRPFTPRHNGKVERSHRKDNEYFYATHSFYSFNDFKAQLAVHLRKYNNFPMRPLNWNSPKATLNNFLRLGVTYH